MGGEGMNEQTQRMLLTILTVAITAVMTRPLKNIIQEAVPERRGIRDDFIEAALQAVVRAGAVVLASVLVRWLAGRRR
jgi:hypothetical protein